MDIKCNVIMTDDTMKGIIIPSELLQQLCESLAVNKQETIHFADYSVDVKGILITNQAMKSNIAIIPLGEE